MRRRDLQQAQLRTISALAQEFGIECDMRRQRHSFGQAGYSRIVGEEGGAHVESRQFTRKRRLLNDSAPRPSAIFGIYADIARFRRGPEDLPASANLLLVTLVCYALLDALLLSIAPNLPGNHAVLIGIDIGVTLFWYWMLLRIARKPERYLQTVSAVFGFQLVLAPVLLATGWAFLKYQADPTWQLPVALLRLVVEVWALVVLSRILRSATGWPMAGCVALSIAQELITLLLVSAIVPAPVVTAT